VKNTLYFLKNIDQVGAVAPSSRFLARKMANVLDREIDKNPDHSYNMLELGAGTGSMTKYITQHMRPQDHLDIIEIEEPLYKQLENKYGKVDNVDIFHGDYLEFKGNAPYDIIFSSLPYEGIPNERTEEIWEKKLDDCKDGGQITYFKYISFDNFSCDFEERVVEKLKQRQDYVFLNLPPARLFVLELDHDKLEMKPA
jgi:phosphatidylethanolamine/phosphatidyl-N-methylethanolamine N-methyltransferase